MPYQRPRWDLNPCLHRDRVASIPSCSARTYFSPIAQVGLEPTASLVLSQGGLPIAYRAMSAFDAQGGIRTRKHSILSRVAHLLAYLGVSSKWSRVDSNHRSSSCKEAAFATGLQDRIKSKMDSSGIAPESSVCRTDVFLLDHEPECSSPASGSRGTRTHKRDVPAACFQDRFLIRPDDFRNLQVAGVGIEPTPPGSEPSIATSSDYPATIVG